MGLIGTMMQTHKGGNMSPNEIKKLRTDMGMNRKEFCDYYNIPYRTVTDWEAGKRKMPEYVLELMEFKADVEQLKTASTGEI